MKTLFRTYGFGLALVGAAHTASAQSSSPRLPERPAVGVSVGFSANADENSGLASRDVSSMFEIPLEHEWRFRIDAGRAAWRFGVAPIPDSISLTRTTGAVIYTKSAPIVGHPVGRYFGAGVGVYHYESERRATMLHPTTLGGFGIGGFEVILPDAHIAIVTEGQLHVAKGPNDQSIGPTRDPNRSLVISPYLVTMNGLIGIKWRF